MLVITTRSRKDHSYTRNSLTGAAPILKLNASPKAIRKPTVLWERRPGQLFPNQNIFDPTLINTVGHTAGVILFGLIIVLLIRDGRLHGTPQIKMSLVAALLAFGWNIGSLVVIASAQPESLPIQVLTTASFSVLSLLPAVLLHVTLQGKHQWLVRSGYLVSCCSAALHFSELLLQNTRLHQLALVLIVAGFGILTVSAFWLQSRQNWQTWRVRADWISLACLLLFTTSFLHFGYEHVTSPWAAEIAWHHLGIPVALIVLLRDYRFLLLDTFVRFFVNSILAALYVAVLLVLNERFQLFNLAMSSAFWTGISLVALCLSLILFAYLRNQFQLWVTRVVFRRQSVERCIQTITELASRARSEQDVLVPASEEIARHLGTNRFVLVNELRSTRSTVRPSVLFPDEGTTDLGRMRFHAEVQVPLRFSSGDTRYLLLGTRHGGRRYLSEDLEDMRRLGAAIVEQVERFRADELRRLASEAELRALQAQINPHFLFNALNALYGTIDRRSQVARRLVLNLADVFRYLLRGERTMISLSEEFKIVQAYLEIEEVRLGDRIQTELIMDNSVGQTGIPVLSIQPLVENAVKHGIAPKHGPGRVSVRAEREHSGVRISIEDTGVGFERRRGVEHNGTGLGLENVRRRLALCYGSATELEIRSGPTGTVVAFVVPDHVSAKPNPSNVAVRA